MRGGIIMIEMTPVVVAGVTQIARVLADTYIKPKLEELYKNSKTQKELDLIEYSFKEYIERSYNIYLYMNTIVFKNQQKTINDLYIPLTVIKARTISDKREVQICIDKYKNGFLPYYRKILLVDNAGMGKSTIIKYLYLSLISEKKGIPILIELRKLEKDMSIIDFVMNEINGIRKCFNIENILELMERGDFIFFFDGYDEITEEAKKQVTENIQKFISKTSTNTFIISSREEGELSCFGDFQRFDIRPLKHEEAYELIRKYDQNGELSKELIGKLQTQKNLRMINELLENPLMVSLLYKAFEYKKTIPYKKHIFYRQVYDALFEDHDMSKGGAYVHHKKSELDIEDFHRVLRTVGFITLAKGIIYSKEEFNIIVNQTKNKNLDIKFNDNNFIYDILHSVPMFIKDGIEYRWSHKSFQEYFAASYICFDAKENQSKFLKIVSRKDKIEKYYNVLDFYYDIDYKGFLKNIIYPIINDMEQYYKQSYCSNKYNNYDIEQIQLRKAILFKYEKIKIKKLDEKEKKYIAENKIAGSELFEYYFKEIGRRPNKGLITNEDIGVFHYTKNLNTLITLLYNKSSTLIKKIPYKYMESKYEQQFIELIDCATYTINDDTENILNRKDLFNLANSFIFINSHEKRSTETIVFDYDNCIELKKQIEMESKLEENDIDFL